VGRKRTTHNGLPPRLHPKAGKYWHVAKTDRKWTDLGPDLAAALQQYAQLEGAAPAVGTFAELADRYIRDGMGNLKPKTIKEYKRQKPKLVAVFGHLKVADIKPPHVARYLDMHPSPVSANREIALMSSMFRKGMRWGMAATNPCIGVEGNEEFERQRYITDDEFVKVRATMPEWIKCMMDLAYITALRERVLLDLKVNDFTTSGLLVTLNKTRQGKVRRKLFAPNEFLGTTFERAKKLRKDQASEWIFPSRFGRPYTTDGFQSIWQRRLTNSGVPDFHFHDIRAKALTDAEEMEMDAQLLAGHATKAMTERYIKFRRAVLTPTLGRML
jgi:integrase